MTAAVCNLNSEEHRLTWIPDEVTRGYEVDEELCWVAVTCQGKNGVMKLYPHPPEIWTEGGAMQPSEFEKYCGKGQNKKWKVRYNLVGFHGRTG